MDTGSLRRNYQWYSLGVLWAGAFILALLGFAHYSAMHRLAFPSETSYTWRSN